MMVVLCFSQAAKRSPGSRSLSFPPVSSRIRLWMAMISSGVR